MVVWRTSQPFPRCHKSLRENRLSKLVECEFRRRRRIRTTTGATTFTQIFSLFACLAIWSRNTGPNVKLPCSSETLTQSKKYILVKKFWLKLEIVMADMNKCSLKVFIMTSAIMVTTSSTNPMMSNLVTFGNYDQQTTPTYIPMNHLPENEQWTEFSSCIRFLFSVLHNQILWTINKAPNDIYVNMNEASQGKTK